jgi:HEAT repeat protein
MSLPLSYTNSDTIEELIKQLSNRDGVERQKARDALVKIGRPAVLLLSGLVENPNHHVRWEATKALGEIGDPAAAPALVTALNSDEDDIRWLAADGLVSLGLDGVGPLLQELIVNSGSCQLREGAHHVVRELVRRGHKQLLAPILDALSGPAAEDTVPVAAEKALEQLGRF